jgi:hypothetical protein
MNERFLGLIRLLGDSGYEVKAIKWETPVVDDDIPFSRYGKPIGDIVLRISPIGLLESEVNQ